MSVRLPSGGSRRDDDELLDRIAQGEPVDGGDVERMLSNWRATMPTAGPADDRLLDAVTATVARPRRGHRRFTATAAAAALLVGGGLAVAATQAGPDSPLWPVTQLVFGETAESQAAHEDADDALEDARTAVDQGRLPEANRLLAQADELVDKVEEPDVADRLRDDIATIRELLRRGVPTDATAPNTPPTPTGDVPSPAPSDRPGRPARPPVDHTRPPVHPPVETPAPDDPPPAEPGPTLPVEPPALPTQPPPPRPGKPPGFNHITSDLGRMPPR